MGEPGRLSRAGELVGSCLNEYGGRAKLRRLPAAGVARHGDVRDL